MNNCRVRTTNNSSPARWRPCGPVLGLLGAGLGLWLLSGCSANQYRKSADREIYGIIQKTQQGALGHTNGFNIDTPYSHRKPAEIFPAELIDSRLQTNRRVLSIEAALELAVQTSREYQTAKEVLYQAGRRLSDVRYQYKPVLDAGGTPIKIENGVWSSAGGAKLSFSQLLRSGGKLGVTLANDLFRYYTGNPQQSVVNTLSVDLFQPILRGFGHNSPELETLTQAERDVVYAVRTFSYYQNQFALGIVNDYFRLLQQKDSIRNSYTNYLRRVESTKRLEARQDRETVSQVDQARQAELTGKNDYVDSVARFLNSLDDFKLRLGLPLGEILVLDDNALTELERAGLIPAPLDSDAAYRAGVQKKLPMLNEIDRFEDSKRKVRIAVDQLRTQLDAFANASYAWGEPNVDKIQYEAGLQLNLPFDRLQQRNSYRSTLISFEAQLRILVATLDSLKDSIEGGLRTLRQRRANHEIQTKALQLANRRVDSETLRLKAGLTEVLYLNQALDDQVIAEDQVTEALVSYQEARLQLMLDIGALETGVSQFWLKDQLAGFLPATPSALPPVQTADQEAPPPDHFFPK